tara:strand:- start:107 stop:832 length:726 start_codon:yes stop_codon:yes gene_type:complete
MSKIEKLDIKNFRINNPICTDTACYLIGDKDSIDKERNKGKIDEWGLTKYIIVDPQDYDPDILMSTQIPYDKKYENLKLNFNENFFYINTGTDGCIPIFHFVKNKTIESFFWPVILSGGEDGFINFSKDWKEDNVSIKKKILNQFSQKKSKWIKIGKLNIPSNKLLIQEGHFIGNDGYHFHKSKKKFEIFAVFSTKKELYEIFIDPKEVDYLKDLKVDPTFSNDNKNILPDEYMFYGLFFK